MNPDYFYIELTEGMMTSGLYVYVPMMTGDIYGRTIECGSTLANVVEDSGEVYALNHRQATMFLVDRTFYKHIANMIEL